MQTQDESPRPSWLPQRHRRFSGRFPLRVRRKRRQRNAVGSQWRQTPVHAWRGRAAKCTRSPSVPIAIGCARRAAPAIKIWVSKERSSSTSAVLTWRHWGSGKVQVNCLSLVAWLANGQTIFAGYSDNVIRVWQQVVRAVSNINNQKKILYIDRCISFLRIRPDTSSSFRRPRAHRRRCEDSSHFNPESRWRDRDDPHHLWRHGYKDSFERTSRVFFSRRSLTVLVFPLPIDALPRIHYDS